MVAGMLLLFAARKYTQPVFADIGGAPHRPGRLVLHTTVLCARLAPLAARSHASAPWAWLCAMVLTPQFVPQARALMLMLPSACPCPHCARRQDDL